MITSSNGSDSTPSKTLETLTTLASALPATPPAGQSVLVLRGQPVPVTELGTRCAIHVARYAKVTSTKLTYDLAVDDRQAHEGEALQLIGDISGALKAMFGPTSPELALWGVTPEKVPTPPSVETKVAAKVKAKATRKARNTLGPKQRKALEGQVPPATPPKTP